MRSDPPRHIRDIAHLYLSRIRRPGGDGVRVVIAGMSTDVMPGFHVANLALAAAARGIPTRIEERSGLPVNAGCFLGLDPSCWVARTDADRPSVAAFARVTFALVSEGGAEVGPDSSDPYDGVEFVHVPSWDAGPEHGRAIARAVSRAGSTVVLYLAERDAEPRPWRETGGCPDVVRRVAYVTRAGRNGDTGECAGTFTRWTRALTDPLPAVVRDPGSRLARQYSEAVSALLANTAPEARVGVRGPY